MHHSQFAVFALNSRIRISYMKILEINKFYFLKGGSERYLFGLNKILKRKGHEVVVFSMKGDGNLPSKYEEYFIEKVDLNKFSIKDIIKFFYNYDAIRKLKKIIKTEKPDIAHLHNIAHQFSPAIISVLKKNNIPVVQTLHDYKLICPNAILFSKNKVCEKCRGGKYYNCFTNRCMKNSWAKSLLGMLEAYLHNKVLKSYGQVDMFIAPSKFMKDKCISFGVPEEKIKVIYNFLDFKDFKNTEAVDLENYILFYGRLSGEKGIETVLDSIKNLKSNINFKIVGSGLDYKKISDKINNLELSDRVLMLGPKYGDELKEVIQKAKAVVIPSLWPENMPYCLLESMASGKAVIIAKSGGMPELINDKENGFVFEPGNSKKLANIIDNIAYLDITEIGRKARKSIEQFNVNSHYKQIIKIFENIKN